MTPLVVGFSGRISSGKTTISRAVATSLSFPHASFGDCVREEAKRRRLDSDSRSILQDLGQTLIAQGWPQFCSDVLATVAWQPGSSLVVDGIRHVKAVRELTLIASPLRFVLVYVATDEQVLADRLQDPHLRELAIAELHSTETDVRNLLPTMADLVVSSAMPLHDAVQEIVEFVQSDMSN